MRRLSQSGFRVWSRGDIIAILAAAEQANADIADCLEGAGIKMYRRGWSAAMRAIAAGFGIERLSRKGV